MEDFFDTAFNYTIQFEGEISDNKNDPGQLTKFGISKKAYPQIDIENLDIENAKKIYYKDFWLKNKCNKIKHKKISIKLFDISVNVGITQAAKILQRAICASGIIIKDDGIIGAKTIEYANVVHEEILLAALKSELAGYYRMIVLINKKLKIFEKGWLRRAYYKL